MPDPLSSQRTTIQSLRRQADDFLRSYANRSSSSSNPLDSIHREAFSGIGGAISGELFGRRRIGASVGRALARNAQQTQRLKAQQAARSAANSLVQQARQVVNAAAPALGQRLSQVLNMLLSEAEAAHRPDTTVRKVLQVVGRLEAWQPTPPSPNAGAPEAEQLHLLERELRRCIETRLVSLTPNWWKERVPPEVRTRAERRKSLRERVWPWLDGGEHPLVEYFDFPDYSKVILEPQNWALAFADVFVDPDALKVKLHELEPIRVDIAHARDLTRRNRDRLRLYADELISQMTP